MTIKEFVDNYSQKENTLDLVPVLTIGTTSVRNFCKENESTLTKDSIIEVVKKMKSERIVITNPEELLKRING